MKKGYSGGGLENSFHDFPAACSASVAITTELDASSPHRQVDDYRVIREPFQHTKPDGVSRTFRPGIRS
jgi:hypothetical protein